MPRLVMLSVTHFLAIVAGVGLGAYLFSNPVRRSASTDQVATVAPNSIQTASNALVNSVDDRILLERVAFLDAALAKTQGGDQEFTYATEKAIALMRLAVLAEQRGAQPQASEYLRRAEAECPATRLRECSADSLRRLVVAQDRGEQPRAQGKLRSAGR